MTKEGGANGYGILFEYDPLANPETAFTKKQDFSQETGGKPTGSLFVIGDVSAPVAHCKDITIQLGTNGHVTLDPIQVDNGSTPFTGLTLSVEPDSFDCTDIGNNTVTLTATNNLGESTCTATVTVQDITPPTAVCRNITVQLNAAGSATITPAQVDNGSSDACGLKPLALNKTTFGCGDIVTNPNPVILTVTDNNNNTATCTATVTVLDITPPTAVCRNITVQLNAAGSATITPAQVDNGSSDACGLKPLALNKTTFGCGDIATNPNPVILTVTDNNNNTATCTATVTVQDITPPTAVCRNITIQLNAAGSMTITPAQVDNGSSDACGLKPLALNKTTFGCGDIATNPNPVVLTVTDNNNNTATCTATVTVQDITPPTAVCRNITIQLNAAGSVTITPAQVDNGSSDACGIKPLALNKTTFGCGDIATNPNPVILTVTDNNNNTATCTATVTVQDKIAPTIICHASPVNVTISSGTVYTNLGSGWDPTVTDPCSLVSVLYSLSGATPGAGSTLNGVNFNMGSTVVLWIATDVSGNPATCSFTVNVTETTGGPVAHCKDITISLGSGGTVNITPELVDNGSANGSLSIDKSVFNCSNIGGNSVILTVTGSGGSTATCASTVSVQDLLPPTVLTKNITVQLNAPGSATIAATDVDNGSSDNCAISTRIVNPSSFTCTNLGTNTVTLTCTDSSGNSASNTATVTVQDKIAPTVSTKNITVQLNASGSAAIAATDVDNGSTDNCSITTRVVNPSSFTCTNLGTNTVTLTCTDSSGNAASNTATVTVQDKIAPTVSTKNITVQLNASGNATIAAADVDNGSTDNCAISNRVVNPSSFTCTNLGTNTVTLTCTDNSGNSASKTAAVTVQDRIAPVVTTKNITVQLNASGNATIAATEVDNGSTDNCAISTRIVNPSSFTCTNLGTNTVTLTCTDNSGNAVSTIATVTVQDKIAPNISCHTSPINITIGSGISYTKTGTDWDPSTSDNCGTAAAVYSLSGANLGSGSTLNGTSFSLGSTIVKWNVSDASGNSSSCSFTVNVDLSTSGPVARTKDITAQLDNNGKVSISASDVDNGSSNAATMAVNPNSFNCSNIGPNTVILTVTDSNGNSATASSTVTIQDKIAPVVSTKNITVQLNTSGNATIAATDVDNGSTDNCAITTRIVNPSSFTCSNLGTNMVTLTCTDSSGNAASKTATVTVQDKIVPVITCHTSPVNVAISSGTSYAHTGIDWDPVVSDNCSLPGKSYSLSGATSGTGSTLDGVTINSGTTSVLWTATDGSGNTATCVFSVIVTISSSGPVAKCKDITIYLDENGLATLTPAQVDNGSLNGTLSIDRSNFSCGDLGNTYVTLTVTGSDGQISTCMAVVQVADAIAPKFTKGSKVVSETVLEGYSFTLPDYIPQFPATDNCAVVSYSQNPPAGTVFSVRTSLDVIITATDGSGNSANTALKFSLKVIKKEKKNHPLLAVITETENQNLVTLTVYPNPFNSRLFFDLGLSKDARVKLEIFDAKGITLTILFNDILKATPLYRFEYVPQNLTEGVFFYRLTVDETILAGRVIYEK
jgi:hypothetical protein